MNKTRNNLWRWREVVAVIALSLVYVLPVHALDMSIGDDSDDAVINNGSTQNSAGSMQIGGGNTQNVSDSSTKDDEDDVEDSSKPQEQDVVVDGAGNVTIKDDSEVKKNLNVSGNLKIGNDVTVTGNVVVGGNLIAGDNNTIKGSLKVGKNVTASGQLDVVGNLEARNGHLKFGDDSTIGGGVIANGMSAGENTDIKGSVSVLGNGAILIGSNSTLSGTLTSPGGLKIGANSDVKLFLSGKTVTINGTEYKLGGSIISKGANTDVGLPFVPKIKDTDKVEYSEGVTPASLGDIKVNTSLKKKGVVTTDDEDITLEDGVIVVSSEDNEDGEVSIQVLSDVNGEMFELNQGDFSVGTTETVSVEKGKIILSGDNEEKIKVEVMPASAVVKADLKKEEVKNIELKIENSEPVYIISGEKKKKFIGIFTISVPFSVRTNAQTGAVSGEDNPWWSFMAF